MKEYLDYADILTDTQVAAVATLDDGWLLTFNRAKLLALVEKMDNDKFIIFIKSSEKTMEKGGQN